MNTVLLVDDEPDIVMVGSMALRDIGGLEVMTASSGAEAIEALNAATPDVIVLDVMMPNMDGPTTLAKIREKPDLAAIPVVFLTAKAQPSEMARYLALGAAGVIAKPFDPMTLADQIRELVE